MNQLLLVVALILSLVSVGYATDACAIYTQEKECLLQYGETPFLGTESSCSFCAESGCMSLLEGTLKSLWGEACTFPENRAYFYTATSGCASATSEKSCLSAVEGSEKCAYCSSAAVGASCYKESDAKQLPSSIFTCEYQK